MASPAHAESQRIDLQVLLATDGTDPVEAVLVALVQTGVPVVVVNLKETRRPVIDDTFLSDTVHGAPRAKFQAVVLPNEDPFGPDSAELDALVRFEQRFGIRQLSASVQPSPAVGLVEPVAGDYRRSFDGETGQLTDEALAGDFAYARGPVPFEDVDPGMVESLATLANPLPEFRTFLSAQIPGRNARGALAGVVRRDGREELVLTFTYNQYQPQFQLLVPGLVRWLTKGVHLGYARSYFSVHADDVFLPNARWVTEYNCEWGTECPDTVPAQRPIRMTPDDVAYLVQWQRRNQLRINMVFNGWGSASIGPDGRDPLTKALLANKNAFGWINHTWSHLYLSCVPDRSVTPWRCATIPIFRDVRYVPGPRLEEEIRNNIEFAKRHDLPIDPTELVTGEHSGLRALPETPEDNPYLDEALIATGIRITASDATRELEQRTIGSALTLPRHPIGVAYNTGTVAEVVDKYSFDRTSKADGGSGDCSDNCIAPLDPRTGFEDLMRREVALASRYILANDPRPHYLHQSNLAEERTAYPVLERILQGYRGLIADNRPLIAPTMTEAASILAAQGAYTQAINNGQIAAWIKDGVVTVETTRQVPIPLTAPEGTTLSDRQLFGQPYGAERSAWIAVVGQQRFVLAGGQL